MPAPDDLEACEWSSDDVMRRSRIKLGAFWLCATLAGAAALAYSSMSHASPTLTMLALAVLLVAYAGYGYSLEKKHTVQFADSLYYMGFLWALFALIATFVIWPAPKLTTETVLTTFGYALAATFCGMLLRMVIIHFDDTLPDRLVYAQEMIDRRLAALTDQLDEATRDISLFRDRATTDLGRTLEDLVQSLTEVRKRLAEQQVTMAEAMSEALQSALREIVGRLSAMHIPQEMLTTEVTKLVAVLESQREQFERAAHGLEQRLTQVAESVTAFGDSLTQSEASNQVGDAIRHLSSKITERTEQFVDMTTTLEKSRRELDGQLESLHALRTAVATVSAQLSTFEMELKEVSSASLSAELRNGLMNVQKAVRSSLEASMAIESTMRDVLFFMRERITEERSSGRT
jgi:hypothetical protein